MELHCDEDIFCFLQNEMLSNYNETDSSNDYFENFLYERNSIEMETQTQNSVSSLEADPLLSEAQLFDGQTLLDAFDIRIPSESLQSSLDVVMPSNKRNNSFDGSKSLMDEAFSPKRPKREILQSLRNEIMAYDSGKKINNTEEVGNKKVVSSCNTNNAEMNYKPIIPKAKAKEPLRFISNVISPKQKKNNTEVIYKPSIEDKATETSSAILKSVDNQSDANGNLFKINNDGARDSTKKEIFSRNPPHMIELGYKNNAASLIFKNAEGQQVLMTQHLELPENYVRPKRLPRTLQKEVHKILSITQIPICKELEHTLPQVHTNLGAKIYLCPMNCVKAYLHIVDARLHALKHMQIKPYKCDEPYCSWKFYTSCKLARHRDTHIKQKNFVCEKCDRNFSTVYNLNEHKRKHSMPATLKCPVKNCDAMFQNEKQRRAHCHKTHDHAEAPFRCNLNRCTKSFFTEALLEAHVRSCSQRESEIACSYPNCGKIFSTPYRLREHIRQHTGVKPYRCQYENCTWSFPTASKLKRHQSIHVRERKFHCIIGDCKKSFLRSEHLKDHTLTHIERSLTDTEEKPAVPANVKKNSPEKKAEATTVQPGEDADEDDFGLPSATADALLEQAIQSLGSDLMSGLLPDEPIDFFDDENFSTVNLRDLD